MEMRKGKDRVADQLSQFVEKSIKKESPARWCSYRIEGAAKEIAAMPRMPAKEEGGRTSVRYLCPTAGAI